MLKTKRRRDGAYVVRTVSYAEKFELQGGVSSSRASTRAALSARHVTRIAVSRAFQLLCPFRCQVK